MGLGDNLMATGMARGFAKQGKRVAFGDGRKIIWDHHSEQIFRGNPNIAEPGSEGRRDLHWIGYHRGNRVYNRQDTANNRWIWNMSFRPVPGEVFFSGIELTFANRFGNGFVVIEPNVPSFKTVAPNKQWPVHRYQIVAAELIAQGKRVVQFIHGDGHTLEGVERIKTPSFRHAMAVLERASLYIGPEGGMHHAAAAVGIPAVVLFGGFIPPAVTGYDTHTNLTGGAQACGSLSACAHCSQAMQAIEVSSVVRAAEYHLRKAA